MEYSKEQCCCFTGHRRVPEEQIIEIKRRLEDIMEDLIGRGVEYFWFGGALGFDTAAALTALTLREQYSFIKVILVLPCRNQSSVWRQPDVDLYNWIISQADEIIYTADDYDPGCMHRRNHYLVDHCTFCVYYLTQQRGGTFATVKYARSRGLTLIPVADGF